MALNRSCGSATDGRNRELVRHGVPSFPLACYWHDGETVNRVPWHWHDELETILVKEGRITVFVEGERRDLGPGEGCFIAAGALHHVLREGAGPADIHSMVFHPRLVGEAWRAFSGRTTCGRCWRTPPTAVSGCRGIPLGAGGPGGPGGGLAGLRRGAAGLRVPGQGRAFPAGVPPLRPPPCGEEAPSEKALRDGERIKTMLRYVQEHYAGELTAARIAQSAAVSESECLRCFRSMMGTTPMRYVRQLRVQRAAELLETTEEKIADVGAACGFQEMSYFARTFRAFMGKTPREYRAERRAAAASGTPWG